MSGGNRKREQQKSMEQHESEDEQSEHGSVESRELGGKHGSGKGQVKQNHSEIEKRRRDKMNTYINELSTLIPMCSVMSRKLDKLTVLRMAVQHMRTLKGEKSSPESNCKPSFLSDEDFKNLILESADGFLFVVACDRGRILYVSDSVQKVVSQSQSDLVGQSFYDLVHPKDVVVVKEQLSCFDILPRDRTAEKPLPQPKQENKQGSKPLCTGARRSFLCRMKSGTKSAKRTKGNDGESNSEFCIMNRKSKNKALLTTDKKKHVVVHFTGYLKSWPPSGYSLDEEDEEQDYRNMSCLVAVGREVKIDDKDTINANPEFTNEFESRHNIDGKFIHVDQRVTSMCGYLPHELIGKSGYEYFHPDDLEIIADSHKSALQGKNPTTAPYRFLCKAGHYIYLCTKSNVFRNPWTKELEFIICINTRYNHKKDEEQSSIQHLQHNPLPRFILPVPNSQSLPGSSGAEATQGRKQSIRELMTTIQSQEQGKPSKQPSPGTVQPVSNEEGDADADLSASKLGTFIAETVQLQEATEKRQHASVVDDTVAQSVSVGEQSESSFRTIDSSGSLVDFSEIATPIKDDASSSQGGKFPSPSSFPRVPTSGQQMPGLPEISQPHLLEQLIGMQQAIESMESPMQQNEESMAVFMNMLEADAGLGGDLSDFLFPDGS